MLRLGYGLSQDPIVPYRVVGGDSGWYLANGFALVAGVDRVQVAIPGTPDGKIGIDLSGLPAPPVYLTFIGFWRQFLGPEAAVIVIRLLQALMSVCLCYFAYRLAWLVAGDVRTGLLAAAVLAVSPVFVMEPAQILTETLYMFLLTAGLWVYMLAVQRDHAQQAFSFERRWILAGIILGLATLTRAVLLLFPLGLVVHLILVLGWRKAVLRGLTLMLAYGLVVSTWTVVNKVKYDRWVIGAQGFSAFLFIGASDQGWQGPEQTDANLAQAAGVVGALPTDPAEQQQLYGSAASSIIGSNPLRWVSHRTTELIGALLQPHGTVFFPGDSLKDMAAAWGRNDRSLTGLIGLTQGDAFWPKLAIYSFHYVGMLAGLVGIWLTRRNWRITLPLVGLMGYTLLVHFVLDAIPRYLFPLDLFFWVFGAATISRFLPVISYPLIAFRQRTTAIINK